MLHEGDEVKVKVLEIHPEEHRIALSIKALEEKPASEEEPKMLSLMNYQKKILDLLWETF